MIRDKLFKTLYNPRDKDRNINNYRYLILNKLHSLFKYEGLTENGINKETFLNSLYTTGTAGIIKVNNTYKCLYGAQGGELDENYNPLKWIIANPYLKLNKEYENGKDCIIIYNDSLHTGLSELINKYAALLVENELSLYLAIINTRNQYLISATDDGTYKSALKFLEDTEKGKQGVILENAFLEGLKTAPLGQYNNFTYMLECESYLNSALYQELGLNANKDQKRESLASAEVGVNNAYVLPLIDDMLETQREGFKRAKDLWGLDIKVSKNSAWELTEKAAEKIETEEETSNKEEVKEDGRMDEN